MNQVIKIDSSNPDQEKIKIAAKIIKSGGVVAFPTETVYGLGADVFNHQAIERIFQIKKRPANIPLPVQISNLDQLSQIVTEVSETAKKIIYRLWPGPLTLIFKKNNTLRNAITGGKDTVGVRMPDHPIAFNLIKESNTLLAVPSANIHGDTSPATADEVITILGNQIDLIIDGGKTSLGIDSTVLDLTVHPPKILRQGKITQRDLENVYD